MFTPNPTSVSATSGQMTYWGGSGFIGIPGSAVDGSYNVTLPAGLTLTAGILTVPGSSNTTANQIYAAANYLVLGAAGGFVVCNANLSMNGGINMNTGPLNTGGGNIAMVGGQLQMGGGNIVSDAATGSSFGTAGTQKIGFYGSVATQPTVTGSKGANAALTSLLTALANLGLIVNSST